MLRNLRERIENDALDNRFIHFDARECYESFVDCFLNIGELE